MDWNFKYDYEKKEINCFNGNGLFNPFAFYFQNSSVFMKNNWYTAMICVHEV